MNNIYFIMIVRVMIYRSFTVRRKNLYSKTSLIIYLNNKYFKKYREKIDDNGKEYHTLYDAKIVSL